MRALALILALCASSAPAVATAGPPAKRLRRTSDEAQEILIEIVVGSLAKRTVVAFELQRDALLPVRDFFDLIEMPVRVDSLGRMSAIRHPGEIPLFLDPLSGTASVGDSSWAVAASQTLWSAGTLYVSTSVLAALLDLHFVVDWAKLSVTVTNPGSLPLALRLARERARRAAAGPFGRVPDRSLTLERPRWDGAVLDWSLLSPDLGAPLNRTYFRSGLGLNLFGGSLELAYENYDRPSGPFYASWLGVWPEKQKLRQIGIGDVLATGPRPGRVRGAFITNTPFMRPAFFGSDLLYGTLPPGWEVELYQNGRLIDYTQSGNDGSYELLTQLFYGSNPLELRAYGPGGQMQLWERTVPIERERLPAGVFEYGVSAGQCQGRLCEAAANVDLHYGVTSNWTIRGGMEAFGRDSLPTLFQPYASVFGNIASTWIVRAEAMLKGHARASLAFAPSPDLRIGGGGAVFDVGDLAPILTPRDRLRELRTFAFWRPMRRFRTFFFEASATMLHGRRSDLSFARIGASFQTGVVRWIGGARRETTKFGAVGTTRTLIDVAANVNMRRSDFWPISRLFMSTRMEVSSDGVERFDWQASRPITRFTRLDARVGWIRGNAEPYVAFGVTATLPAARTSTQVRRTPESSVAASLWAEGSVIWNGPSKQVGFAPRPSLRRGGLGGTVYLDANGNGRYDGLDQPLDGVRLQVGSFVLETDEKGNYGVWDLVPFVPVNVALDSMSLENPLWVPSFSMATVIVDPNMVRRLDVPVLPSAEVGGRVILQTNTGPQPLGALRLHLVNRQTGRRHEAITFSDGEFYVLGLVPGEYEVSIPEWARDALGIARDQGTTRFRVVLRDGWAEAPFIEIELIPDHN